MQYLVIDLDFKQVRGVFATPQEADRYVDLYCSLRDYHSKGYVVVPVEIKDGKIEPIPEVSNNDDEEVSSSFLRHYQLDELGIKDELEELK